MEIIHTPREMTAWANRTRAAAETIALVPTMGAFHDGHLALMRAAAQRADRLVVSLFVNPIQFGASEDLDRYPRNLKRDAELAAAQGTDILFAPAAEAMYPRGFATKVGVAGLTDTLCGASRPGHFDGVTTVVAKLFNLVKPQVAVFGEKDFQQLAVIRRMVADLAWDIDVVGHPIVREADGLAMSSRNVYLAPEERQAALGLSRALAHARQRVAAGETDTERLLAGVRQALLARPGVTIDYLSVVHGQSLVAQERIDADSVLLVAALVGTTRLIDNTPLP